MILGYFLLVVTLGLSMSQSMRSLGGLRLDSRYVAQQQTRHLAEAALDNGMRQLLTNNACIPGPAPDQRTSPACPLAQNPAVGPNTSYTATITGPQNPALPIYQLDASGTNAGITQTLRAMVLRESAAPFPDAVFAEGNINVTFGSRIDSYDSALGLYNADLGGGVFNVGSQGNLESNTGLVTVHDNNVNGPSTVAGTVIANLTPAETNGGIITGTPEYTVQPQDIYYPPPVPPAEPVCSSELGNLSLGADRTYPTPLKPGPIFCADSIDLNGHVLTFTTPNAQLYVRGQFKSSIGPADSRLVWHSGTIRTGALYLDDYSPEGDVHISGKTDWYVVGQVNLLNGADINNNTKVVEDFRLYVTKTSPMALETVDIRGVATDFYGLLYAPEMHVEVDIGPHIYGAIVSSTTDVENGSYVHYDQALRFVTDFPAWLVPLVGGPSGTPKVAKVAVKAMRFLYP